MKLGIRSQLNIAFILVVVLPLTVTFIMLRIVTDRVNSAPDYEHLSQPDVFFERMIQKIQNNFADITTYKTITKELEPYFDKFEGYLQIIDTEGRILYDSFDSDAFIKNKIVPFESIYVAGIAHTQINLHHKRRINPVFADNKLVGVSIFEYEENRAIGVGVRSIMFYIITSILAGFICLIVLMFLLTLLITRNILIPLKELGAATRKIAQGDLDFNIDYSKKNELGIFCEAFISMKEQLKAAIIKQKQEENEKKELIANISHDLRTPMTSIRGYVEALKDGKAKDSETYTRYLSVIEKKTEGLDRLIDDLAMFSKHEPGKMTMYYEEVDSREMLENIANIKEAEYDRDNVSVLIKRPFPSVKDKFMILMFCFLTLFRLKIIYFFKSGSHFSIKFYCFLSV